MCSELKKAVVWSNYLNAQLDVLWRNAQECGNKDELKCHYYRALAYYHYASRDETDSTENSEASEALWTGDIEFGKPEFTFICNHSVVLTLTVTKGTLSAGSQPEM